MTWGNYFVVAGATTWGLGTVGMIAYVIRTVPSPSDADAFACVFLPLLAGLAVGGISRFDPAIIAREKESEAIAKASKTIAKTAQQLYEQHLKTTGLSDLVAYVKRGTVPEQFVAAARATLESAARP